MLRTRRGPAACRPQAEAPGVACGTPPSEPAAGALGGSSAMVDGPEDFSSPEGSRDFFLMQVFFERNDKYVI